jgi:hypothetical protein
MRMDGDNSADTPARRQFKVILREHTAMAEHLASIEAFGNELARRMDYKAHRGIDAVHYYLVAKHNWLPSQVQHLSAKDLTFLLAEEMAGWLLPPHLVD